MTPSRLAMDQPPAAAAIPGAPPPPVASGQAPLPTHPPELFLRGLFQAAVAAADPALCVPPCLPRPAGGGDLLVLGAGKAAVGMARAVLADAAWARARGLIIAPHGEQVPRQLDGIEVRTGAHPLPDAAGAEAAARMLHLAGRMGRGDMVLFLLSGGASSLMPLPRQGLDLSQKQALTGALMASGAGIEALNVVRKHLSAIKGGQLAAAAWPARVVTLALSDVVGDDPTVIGSGPTVADPSTAAEALAVLDGYGILVPELIRERLVSGEWETPKPGDPRLEGHAYHLIASPIASLQAAANAAQAAGVRAVVLGDGIEGESREVGRVMAGLGRAMLRHGLPAAPPAVLISGGETTVTLSGAHGRGGPNTEAALGFAAAARGTAGLWFLAADTDGIDGYGGHAGAIAGPETLAALQAAGLDPATMLAAHDSARAFEAAGGLLLTGPTGTNVNDFRAIYAPGPAAASGQP